MPYGPLLPPTLPPRHPFTLIPDAVLLDRQITPLQLRIYAVIARRADRETASAFPSYKTIAADAHISRRSAVSGVAALVARGYLAKQSRQSGLGDATSNRYTVTGDGSEIFAPPRAKAVAPSGEGVQDLHRRGEKTAAPSDDVVQNLHHRRAKAAALSDDVTQELHHRRAGIATLSDEVAPNFHHRREPIAPQGVKAGLHGGAIGAPEPDSPNQRQKNKTQENQAARAYTHEASAAAAASPELQRVFLAFQENIGALTSVARQMVEAFVGEFGAPNVVDAIREAVIYEKRSLGYMRRVLGAWQRSGRAPAQGHTPRAARPAQSLQDAACTLEPIVWPPAGPDDDLATEAARDQPAAAAWEQICQQLPQLGRLTRIVTPVRLEGDLLTVSVPDTRTYRVMTQSQRYLVDDAVQRVLGDGASLRVELVGQEATIAA